MKIALPSLYAEYGRYINRFRALPYHIDALKPVERRLLLSLYKTAKTGFVKSAKVIGHCIGHYHPHGDQSTYESLVSLVRRGFGIPQGNWGSKFGLNEVPPAAMRYTEVKINPNVLAMFEDLLQFAEHQELELDNEPLYLPSIVPLGLIGDDVITGISFYSTKIPQYTFRDLLERLKYLLKLRSKIVIEPNFYDCDMQEENGSFEKILTSGEGKITITPKYEIEKNGKYFVIKGRNRIFGYSKLINECNKKGLTIIDNSKTKTGTRIIIEPAKKVDDKIIETLTYSISFACYFVDDDGNAIICGIDKILLNCLSKYKESYNRFLNYELDLRKQKMFELRVVEVIRNILKKHPNVKKVDEIVSKYDGTYKDITKDDIRKVCNKYSISSLIEYKADMDDIKTQIDEITDAISNIDREIKTIIEAASEINVP